MINFLKYRNVNLFFSMSFLLVSAGFWWRNGIDYSIDFSGGTQIQLRFTQATTAQAIQDALIAQGMTGVLIREFSPQDFVVRVKEFSSDAQGQAGRVSAVLTQALPGNQVTVAGVDSVGATAGSNLISKAIKMLLLGLLIMLAYVAVRFEFSFALGAVFSLLHDALTMFGAFIVMGKEISPNVIVAILTILGYSINDTIVIFTRIRENLGKVSSMSMYDLVNLSINQTLRRTILTTFATLLTVIAFLVFGGESLRDLSLALFIGMIVGAYSTVYIASPIMMLLHKEK